MTRTFGTGYRAAAVLATAALLTSCSWGSSSSSTDDADAAPTTSSSPTDTATTTPAAPDATDQPDATTAPTIPGIKPDGPAPTMTRPQVKKTRKAVRAFNAATPKVLESANPPATGSALATLQAQQGEYDAYGWRVVGEPTLLRYDVLGTTKNPDGLLVAACIDDSNVKIIAKNGASVDRGKRTPMLTIYTLVEQDGRWVVADLQFPDDPSC